MSYVNTLIVTSIAFKIQRELLCSVRCSNCFLFRGIFHYVPNHWVSKNITKVAGLWIFICLFFSLAFIYPNILFGVLAVHAKLLQLYPALCKPMGCGLPGSSVHEVLQARILEWAAMPSSRGSSRLRDKTHMSYISCIGRQVLHSLVARVLATSCLSDPISNVATNEEEPYDISWDVFTSKTSVS